LAPRFTDKVMERIMYSSHQSRTRHSSGSRSRALHEPGYGGEPLGTHEPHLLRSRSLYVQATKRPMLTAAALATAGVLLSTALRNR
jgi:hypothetical protein